MGGHKTKENTPNNLDFSPLQSELEEMREAVEAAGLLGQELEERERKIAHLTEEGRYLCVCVGGVGEYTCLVVLYTVMLGQRLKHTKSVWTHS